MSTLPGPVTISMSRRPEPPQVYRQGGNVDVATIIAGSYNLSTAKLRLMRAATDLDTPVADAQAQVDYSTLTFNRGLATILPATWTLLPNFVYWVDLLYNFPIDPAAYVRSNPIWGIDIQAQEAYLVGQVDKMWAGRVVQISLPRDVTLSGKTYLRYQYDAEVTPLGSFKSKPLPQGQTANVIMPDGVKKSVAMPLGVPLVTYTA